MKFKSLYKKIGLIAIAIAPIVLIAGEPIPSKPATSEEVENLTSKNVTKQPTKVANRNVLYGTPPSPSDITLPVKAGFSFKFISATPVNYYGISTVIFRAKSTNKDVKNHKDLSYRIRGFQTKWQKLAAIADAITKKLTPNDIPIKPKIKLDSNLEKGFRPAAHHLIPPKKKDFVFRFLRASIIDDSGEATVTYETTSILPGAKISKQLTFDLSIFDQEKAAKIKTKKSIIESVIAKPAKANAVNYGATPTKNDVTLPVKSTFNFVFVRAMPVNYIGKSIVTFRATSTTPNKNVNVEVDFVISGFQTRAEAADATTKNLTINDVPIKPKIKADSNLKKGFRPAAYQLIPPKKKNYAFWFKKSSIVNKSGEATVTYEAISIFSKTRVAKRLTFDISIFDEKTATKIKMKRLIIESVTTKPAKANNVDYGDTPTRNDVTLPVKPAFTFVFIKATPVNTMGKSVVTFRAISKTLNKNLNTEVDFDIFGFQTGLQAAHDATKKLTINDVPIKPKIKPNSNLKKGFRPGAHHLIHPKKKDFVFRFLKASIINKSGEATATYETTSNFPRAKVTKELTFELSIFDEKTAAKIKMKRLIIESITARPTKINDVNYNTMPTKNDVKLPAKPGFTFMFLRATAVNNVGKSTVTFRATSRTPSKNVDVEVDFDILGFQTKVEAANIATEKLTINKVPIKPKIAPISNIANGFRPRAHDFIAPQKEGYAFRFVSATIINYNGISTVAYEVFSIVSGASAKKNLNFKVSGFQTKAAARVANANNSVWSLLPTSVPTKPIKLASSFVEYGTKPKPSDITIPKKSDFRFRFVEATVVNGVGKSIVTFEATSEIFGATASKNLDFTISGFQTKVEAANIAVAKLRPKDVPIKPKIASSSKLVNGAIPLSNDFIAPKKEGFTFNFKKAFAIDEDGISIVIFKVTSNVLGANKEKDLTFFVSGFQTKAKAIIAFANNRVKRLTISDILKKPKIAPISKLVNGSTPLSNDFVAPKKEGFVFKFLRATNINAHGMAIATYEVTSNILGATAKKNLNFNVFGFETKIVANANALVEKLTPNNVNVKPTKAPNRDLVGIGNKPTKDDVIAPAKPGFAFKFARATVVDRNGASTITFKVTSIVLGATSENFLLFSVSDFSSQITIDSNKFNDFKSPTNVDEVINKLKIVNNDVSTNNIKADFKKIVGYKDPDLNARIIFDKAIVKKALNPNTRQVVYTLMFSNLAKETLDKDVIVTFAPNWNVELSKLNNFETIDDVSHPLAMARADATLNKKVEFVKIANYKSPRFTKGVKIQKVVVAKALNRITRQVVFAITLWDGVNKNLATKDITITFAKPIFSFAKEIKKFKDFITTDTSKSNAAMLNVSNKNVKDIFEAITGYETPILKKGVKIQKVVAKALNRITRQVVFAITLWDGVNKNLATKDITVTFAAPIFSFAKEIAKFKDFITTDSIKSNAAMLNVSNKNVKDIFEAITGYETPILKKGVKIQKVVVKNAINNNRQVVFTIKLAFEKKEAKKDVIVTFSALPSKTNSKKLKNNQIIGIATGSTLGLGIITHLIYYLAKRKK